MSRALMVACLLASSAHAEPARFTAWLDLPTKVFAGEDDRVQLAGATFSGRVYKMVTAEVSVDYLVDACVKGFVLTPRAGVAPVFAETGAWSFAAPLLGGVTYGTLEGGGCDLNPDETMVAVTASAGVEARRARGLAVRLIAIGGSYRDSQRRDHMTEWVGLYTATLSVGFGF